MAQACELEAKRCSMELGKLEKIDLRNVWLYEDRQFTPWLAEEFNLAQLGDAIGLELELEAIEKQVGPFRADILCKDLDSEELVLIENQLSSTDHKHLGQIITYAAGLDAKTIIWITSHFTEEHAAALDWLNEGSTDGLRFFGVEIEAYRIGNSAPAPMFNVICKPNDWSRTVSRAAKSIADRDHSETQLRQREFWEAFANFLSERKSLLGSRKPLPQHWTNFALGRSGFKLAATIHSRESRIGSELFIRKEPAKEYFDLLYAQKSDVETEFGTQLNWERLDNRKGCRIGVYCEGCDPMDESDWPRQHAWLKDNLEKLDRIFRNRIRNLNVLEADRE